MEWSERQERARRTSAAWTAPVVYGTIRFLVRALFWPYFRIQTVGRRHIPTDGPVILAPVHRSNLDSLLLAPLMQRRFRALAKEGLFKLRPLAWVMASLGALPLRRDTADRESMRTARELLSEGNILLVFPEGKRHKGDVVGELFDGTGWLAAKTRSRVVPVGIAGTGEAMPAGARFPRPVRVRMVVGPPIDPPEPKATRSELRTWTEGLTGALQATQDEAVVRRG
jgi:1-acyl-sn-glycerol-3-phosphate acyltransferase